VEHAENQTAQITHFMSEQKAAGSVPVFSPDGFMHYYCALTMALTELMIL
jgi:hypothetical protein